MDIKVVKSGLKGNKVDKLITLWITSISRTLLKYTREEGVFDVQGRIQPYS